jgi:predicted acetyltransferase
VTSDLPLQPDLPPTTPVVIEEVTRSDRAVLTNLGQLYRHDLSEGMRLLPNPDGTFNNRRLDAFFLADDPDLRAWIIRAGGALAGFVMTRAESDGTRVLSDFFVVRALRRSGVGRKAAMATFTAYPGPWVVAFQDYNPGAREFWESVAAEVAGDSWLSEHRPVPGKPELPPDTWMSMTVRPLSTLPGMSH